MKEPITGRDLFVISTLCTGFGALLAWGLFYRWGSAPDSKPFDLPAWVQAIGSVVGIFVAIAVPLGIYRQKEAGELRKDRLRARGFALMLLPIAEQFLSNLRLAKAYARGDEGNEADFHAAHLKAAVPDQLQSRVTELHDLGAPAERFQAAIAKSSVARQRLDYCDFFHSNHGVYFYEDDVEDLPEPDDPLETLDAAIAELRSAIDAMNQMFT